MISARRVIPGLRWWIVGLLVMGNFLNYVDRTTFALLAPQLQRDIGWSELGYGRIIMVFQLVYAVSSLAGGAIIDRIGARVGIAISMGMWSLAQMAHAVARTAFGFGAARAALGAGEAAGYSGLLKAMTEWFPGRDRGVAAGIVFASVQVAAIGGPIIVPLIAVAYGWRAVFIISGGLGLVLVVPWLALYAAPNVHPSLAAEERVLIHEGQPKDEGPPPKWRVLLSKPQVWAYVLAIAAVNPGWWFVTYWLPKFLASVHHIQGTAAAPYLVAVYSLSAIGALGGGLWSSALIRRGWPAARARKATLLVTALVMPVVAVAGITRNLDLAVLLVGLAAMGHQCWTANVAALLGDLIPARAAGTVAGISNFAGSLVGVASAEATGRILQWRSDFYLPMFAFIATIYGLTLIIMQLLTRGGRPAQFD